MDKKQKAYTLLIFLISPLLAALPAARHFRENFAKYIFIGLIAVFAYNMIIRDTSDAYSHLQRLVIYGSMSYEAFITHLLGIIRFQSQEGAHDDLYLHVISFVVSRFTIDQSIFFLVVGIFFGFFYIGSIQKVYSISMPRPKYDYAIIILFVFFVLWKSVEGMTQIRFWTGAWVAMFGVIMYIVKNDPRYLLLVVAAPLIHFGHNITFFVILSAILLNRYPRVVFLIFIVSFIFIYIPAGFLVNILTVTELGANRAERYIRNPEITSGFFISRRGAAFHAYWYLFAGKLFYTILMVFAVFRFGYFKSYNGASNDLVIPSQYNLLLSIALLALSMANFGNVSGAINMRFSILAGIFASAYFVILYSTYLRELPLDKKTIQFRNLTIALSPMAILVIYTQLSIIGDWIDFKVILSPIIAPILGDEPVSIKEFLRSLL